MTIAILNLNQKTVATSEAFAARDVRTLIANHLGVDLKRVTDEARFATISGPTGLTVLN